jgi:hypothetical protein
MQDYLQGLNERQQEAVLHIDGPLMIIAGAGSGKTKVLTTRIRPPDGQRRRFFQHISIDVY